MGTMKPGDTVRIPIGGCTYEGVIVSVSGCYAHVAVHIEGRDEPFHRFYQLNKLERVQHEDRQQSRTEDDAQRDAVPAV